MQRCSRCCYLPTIPLYAYRISGHADCEHVGCCSKRPNYMRNMLSVAATDAALIHRGVSMHHASMLRVHQACPCCAGSTAVLSLVRQSSRRADATYRDWRSIMRRQPVDLVINLPANAATAHEQSAWLSATSTLVRSVSFELAAHDGYSFTEEPKTALTELAMSIDMLLASTLVLEVGPPHAAWWRPRAVPAFTALPAYANGEALHRPAATATLERPRLRMYAITLVLCSAVRAGSTSPGRTKGAVACHDA